MGNWKEVDAEIMKRLKDSGLLDVADVFVRNECSDLNLYEFPTLQMLDQFCVYNQNYYVFYIHTKGVSRPNFKPIEDWRECMLYFNVDNWKECVEKLDEGFDAVGINHIPTPIPHFQGNFWWTKATHITQLGNLKDVSWILEVNQTERHKAEFWLLSKEAKVYEFYNHHINPYVLENPKENYVRTNGSSRKGK